MIVLRRPLRIFDVDVLGIAVMLALAAAAYLVVVVPTRAQAERRHKLAGQLAQARQRAESAERDLHRFRDLAADLQTLVRRRIAQAPTRSHVNAIVNRLMLEAEQADLHIDNLEPRSPQRLGDTFVCDVEIAGRGSVPSVIAFLDALAVHEPYHSILALNLARPNKSDTADSCQVSIRVRLHLLPDEIRLAKGTQP